MAGLDCSASSRKNVQNHRTHSHIHKTHSHSKNLSKKKEIVWLKWVSGTGQSWARDLNKWHRHIWVAVSDFLGASEFRRYHSHSGSWSNNNRHGLDEGLVLVSRVQSAGQWRARVSDPRSLSSVSRTVSVDTGPASLALTHKWPTLVFNKTDQVSQYHVGKID